MTLVFARERTGDSIREALIDRRTAVWVNDLVIGRKKYLEPLFYAAVELSPPHYIDGRRRKYVKIHNRSDFLLEIAFRSGAVGAYFDDMILQPRSSQILIFDTQYDTVEAVVRNFLIGPQEPLPVRFGLNLPENGGR